MRCCDICREPATRPATLTLRVPQKQNGPDLVPDVLIELEGDLCEYHLSYLRNAAKDGLRGFMACIHDDFSGGR
jgi:hypothetical protein